MKRIPAVSWQLNTEVTIPLFPLPATWIRITFWWIWIIIRMICPFPRGLFKKKFKITSNLNLLLMTFMINHWNFPQWHKCSWGVKRSLMRSQWGKDLGRDDIWYHLGDVGCNVFIFSWILYSPKYSASMPWRLGETRIRIQPSKDNIEQIINPHLGIKSLHNTNILFLAFLAYR